jgi:ABC-type nitrate/sulfonate/bicarbonate transport system ATPase subunit
MGKRRTQEAAVAHRSSGAASTLRLEGLTKQFARAGQEPLLAIQDIALQVGSNEFVALLGPSGCGKSTIFNVIAGLIPPTAGRVLIDNDDITGETGHVGYMFQKDLLLRWRTVLRNMTLGAEVQGVDRSAAESEALQLLDRLGLQGRERSYPAQLSGGMRQRVAFGRTLMCHKNLLLLDEPLGALDAQTREYMQEWLQQIWSEFQKTVLLVTHDLDEAIFLADRIYVLAAHPGRVEREITVALPRPRNMETRLSPEYGRLRAELYELIREEEGEDAR